MKSDYSVLLSVSLQKKVSADICYYSPDSCLEMIGLLHWMAEIKIRLKGVNLCWNEDGVN